MNERATTADGGFTHAARYRVADVDDAGLWAFVVAGNHCACEAVRLGGAVVFQSGGFDGPHELLTYDVVRESDGARVDLWEVADGVGVVFWPWAEVSVPEVDGPESAATAVRAALMAEPLEERRLRFDPHPAGTCRFCE